MISIYRDGETFGPFTMEQIVSMLNEGRVVPEGQPHTYPLV
jgi:hypothetical protein